MVRPNLNAKISADFREAFEDYRQVNQEYFLNKNGKFRPRPPGIRAIGSSGDYHYQSESDALLGIERAYHFDRNDWIVGQAIDRLCDHILPNDFSLDPQTGDEGLDKELQAEWYDWAYNPVACDLEQQDDFMALERLAFRSMFVGGDAFFLPLDSGHLQMHEAHRCRRPDSSRRTDIIRGVEVDSLRRRKAFWFTKDDISSLTRIERVNQTTRVDAYDGQFQTVFQLYNRRRQQLRGVSCMASCVDAIGMHGDLQFAALVKAQVSACYAIIEELSAGVKAPPLPGDATAVTGTVDYQNDGTQEQQIRPGMRYRGREGVKLSGFSPNIPNAEFFPHVKLLLAIIAANIGIPPFMLLLDAGDVGTYGAGRQTVEQARMTFRRYQRMGVQQIRTPIYLWRLRMKAAQDRAFARRLQEDPLKYTRHEFKAPGWKYIDPTKDAKADAQLADDLLAPRSRLAAWQGYDFKPQADEALDDNAYLIAGACARAAQIKKQYPDCDVTFRDVLRLSKAASVTVTPGNDVPDNGTDPPANKDRTDGE